MLKLTELILLKLKLFTLSCHLLPNINIDIGILLYLNLLTVLATNPIFPKDATITRMSFIGLEEQDFDYMTVYENSSLSKPNPMYYQMLLDKYNLKAEEVIMFGNNEYEDGIASTLGMKVYIVGDFVVASDKLNVELEHIALSQIKETIEKHIK